jgi:hypothetical protein
MPMQLISEQMLPLSELFGPAAAALEEQLYAAVSPEACVPLLDTFLPAHLGSSLNWSRALLEQVGRLLLKVTSCLKWPVGWAAASGAYSQAVLPQGLRAGSALSAGDDGAGGRPDTGMG